MESRILYLLVSCICGCMSMFGQNDGVKVIKSSEATSVDYISLLNASGYEAFPFDISSLTDGQYNIIFRIKEYKDGREIDFDRARIIFRNMSLLSEFPEEDQKNIKPEDMADPDRGIYDMAGRIMVGFIPIISDSIQRVVVEVENMGSSSFRLPMKPQYVKNDSINGKKLYMYNARPFKAQELKPDQFIPLVMYGSYWYDKNIGLHRFCGEDELAPDLSSEILKNIPHYYIIGVELSPIKML